jgi:hypothetical protein
MRRTLSLIVVGLLVTGGTVIGFEVGGRVGFHEGYYIAHRSIEVTNALLALGSLKALEKGDSEGARELLEGLLDVPMFTEWADVRLPSPRHPRFGPSDAYLDLTKPMKTIAGYRLMHPQDDLPPTAKEMVDEFVARYATPPQAEH